MKKSLPNLYEIVRKIRFQLEMPVSSERLHEMMNELMCELCNRDDRKRGFPGQIREYSVEISSELDSLRLEQLANICCDLMSDEKSAIVGLKLFVETYFPPLLAAHQAELRVFANGCYTAQPSS